MWSATRRPTASRFIHETLGLREFEWQRGYSAFSVSATKIDAVTHYIDYQREHHRVKTFREELEMFYEAHGLVFDPRYWDE